ncbi:GNAT family N-acetyltransferase [Candidatus Woesearchaeota archaeon]|nr:GNAT family N-acetyltransferase [Candidatus Woesearchaeota archaeon]
MNNMKNALEKELNLVKATKKDQRFIYQIVKNWLEQTDHSVTVLKIPSYTKFFKTKSIRYIIQKKSVKIGFVHILDNNEIGYYLIPEFQGRGIGTWAVAQLMKIESRNLYYATINNKNIGSVRLVEKLGFKPKAIIYEKKTRSEVI